MNVAIRDVTLRDGLQSEAPIPTAAKVAIAEALVAAGIAELELTSFVRPDRVPALADAEQVVAATARLDVVRWGLVLNERGAERAMAAGLRHLQFVVSVSEAHQRGNVGRSVEDSLAELARLTRTAQGTGARVEVTLATAFGCPYTGPVPPERVVELGAVAADHGVDAISLADTIGSAVPSEVASLVTRIRARVDLPVGLHLHDTRGLAVANALAGLGAGASRLDGSLGSLGGCPFAPGATGNAATEDIVHCLEESGIETGVSVEGLIRAAEMACALTGRPLGSHVGLAGRRFATITAASDH